MDYKEKLVKYKEKILSYAGLNPDLGDLIAVELYDYIHDEKNLQPLFDRHFNYLPNLAASETFKALENDLFETIIKITQLTTLSAVEEIDKQLGKDSGFNNKTRYGAHLKTFWWLRLPEAYKAIQSKGNYYWLGTEGTYHTTEEVSLFTSTEAIRKQFNDFIPQVINTLSASIFKKNDEIYKQFEQLDEHLTLQLKKFDEQIYRTALKRHVRAFENFVLFCVERYKREGFEMWFRNGLPSPYKRTTLPAIKEFCSIVIDDLVEDLETSVSKETKVALVIGEDEKVTADFIYNVNTGDGKFKDKEFRLKEGAAYRKIFDACYLIKGQKLEKEKVRKILCLDGLNKMDDADLGKIFSALGDGKARKKSVSEVKITAAINKEIKTIRRKTGLNTKQFVNNGGNIVLVI